MAKLKIKFSHTYKKLQDEQGNTIKNAKLLLAVPVQMESISQAKDFLAYDTDNKYMIPFSSWYVMLLFQKPFGDLFTTVRPMFSKFGNKHKYYEGLIGQEFDIVITQEVHHG